MKLTPEQEKLDEKFRAFKLDLFEGYIFLTPENTAKARTLFLKWCLTEEEKKQLMS